jgi:tRNA (guanine37-N1)-methyltransferase
MRFDIITIFPNIFDSYFNESMIKRAREKKLVDIHVHDLRAFTKDKHKKVDQRPYGGGPGMVLQIEPLMRALSSILKGKSKPRPFEKERGKKIKDKTKIIIFSAGGKQFEAKMARDFAKKYDRLIMISGHYEGVDERIFKVLQATSHRLQAISIGPYVLTGGELPAMVVIDAVSRHLPGFLGKAESVEEKRFGIGVPMYTRPEIFTWPPPRWGKPSPFSKELGKKGKKYKVPPVLLSGDHKKIGEWRKNQIKKALWTNTQI